MSPSPAVAGTALLLAALASGCAPSGGRAPAYHPRTRAFTITAVPLLTREMQRIYPFLARDFGAGGVLEGKEVYAFEPSTIPAVAGDPRALTLVNPEDDPHSFVLGDLAVAMPPQASVTARYVTSRAGIFPFTCSVPTHLPFMYGTLVVLSPSQLGAE